jgi:oligopeptide/dipeptide ABC transporter ATP-binding protein
MTPDTSTQSSTSPLLQVRRFCKYFPIFSKGFMKREAGVVRAVDDINFDLMFGETLGLVGESGSGKTTTARAILRAIKPTNGEVIFNDNGKLLDLARVHERELKSLRPKMQIIFQDPFSSLNPRMTVGDIVGEPLVIHKMAKGSELRDRVEAMLLKVGLKPEYRQRYPHAFSGGQRQRIGIARALIMHPQFVVADEAVSALDVSVQAQVINLLKNLQKELGLTYLFIAHDLSVVKHISDRIAVMYAGRIVEIARTNVLFQSPKHPYTQALLSAVPSPDPSVKMNYGLQGEAVDLGNLPSGCSFHPRCSRRSALCVKKPARLINQGKDHSVACHLYNESDPAPSKSTSS